MVRRGQQALFAIGLIAYIGSAVMYESHTGLILWRVGTAGMLTSIALGLAFPKKS